MKVLSAFLVMVLGANTLTFAQLDRTAFPFSYLNTNIKSLSLGNATVSLDGFGNEEINPAVVGEEGKLQVTPSWQNYFWRLRLGWEHRGVKANYRRGPSTFGISLQRIEAGEQETLYGGSEPIIYKFVHYDLMVKTSYSHLFQNGLAAGMAINYLYSSQASGTRISTQLVAPNTSVSLDLGANYQYPEIQFSGFTFSPHFGMALTDFGTPSHYADPDTKHPLATTLRLGGGANIALNKEVYGRNVMELSVLQNVSKILARMEKKQKENGVYFDAMNPFKALVKSWDNYTYGGFLEKKANFSEQLWWNSGVELKFLETIALRWGYQKAGKAEEEMSYRALGAVIDLYYLVFDYTHIKNDEDDNLFLGHHWQLTGRIPLDGTRPDTILNKLFD